MARIILGSYMIRYPLGGMLSWALQFLKGFEMLGHDVYFVEKAGYQDACYDPKKDIMTNNCSTGIQIVQDLFKRSDYNGKWCFVDFNGQYYGSDKQTLKMWFEEADIFIDMGAHGMWDKESACSNVRVYIDGEPGYTQILWEQKKRSGNALPEYDFYYSAGRNIGTQATTAPDAGKKWNHLWNLVATDLFDVSPECKGAPFTTVMNWQSHKEIEFDGVSYGQKDVEFIKFISLPKFVDCHMEAAIAGRAPKDQLIENGWRVLDAKSVTLSIDDYYSYIKQSRGEFSVCKNVFVETHSGWFSDRSAAYLASGRPVILQDTGFSHHLPCGKGLFAVSNVEEAIDAVKQISKDYKIHSKMARDIAVEYLDAKKLLKRFINQLI